MRYLTNQQLNIEPWLEPLRTSQRSCCRRSH